MKTEIFYEPRKEDTSLTGHMSQQQIDDEIVRLLKNTEILTLKDNELDLILCKDANHRLTRTPLCFHEQLRIATRVGLLHYIFKHTTDHYIPGVDTEISLGEKYFEIEKVIRRYELKKKILGISGHLGIFITFNDKKYIPNQLEKSGFTIKELPNNPYLQ